MQNQQNAETSSLGELYLTLFSIEETRAVFEALMDAQSQKKPKMAQITAELTPQEMAEIGAYLKQPQSPVFYKRFFEKYPYQKVLQHPLFQEMAENQYGLSLDYLDEQERFVCYLTDRKTSSSLKAIRLNKELNSFLDEETIIRLDQLLHSNGILLPKGAKIGEKRVELLQLLVLKANEETPFGAFFADQLKRVAQSGKPVYFEVDTGFLDSIDAQGVFVNRVIHVKDNLFEKLIDTASHEFEHSLHTYELFKLSRSLSARFVDEANAKSINDLYRYKSNPLYREIVDFYMKKYSSLPKQEQLLRTAHSARKMFVRFRLTDSQGRQEILEKFLSGEGRLTEAWFSIKHVVNNMRKGLKQLDKECVAWVNYYIPYYDKYNIRQNAFSKALRDWLNEHFKEPELTMPNGSRFKTQVMNEPIDVSRFLSLLRQIRSYRFRFGLDKKLPVISEQFKNLFLYPFKVEGSVVHFDALAIAGRFGVSMPEAFYLLKNDPKFKGIPLTFDAQNKRISVPQEKLPFKFSPELFNFEIDHEHAICCYKGSLSFDKLQKELEPFGIPLIKIQGGREVFNYNNEVVVAPKLGIMIDDVEPYINILEFAELKGYKTPDSLNFPPRPETPSLDDLADLLLQPKQPDFSFKGQEIKVTIGHHERWPALVNLTHMSEGKRQMVRDFFEARKVNFYERSFYDSDALIFDRVHIENVLSYKHPIASWLYPFTKEDVYCLHFSSIPEKNLKELRALLHKEGLVTVCSKEKDGRVALIVGGERERFSATSKRMFFNLTNGTEIKNEIEMGLYKAACELGCAFMVERLDSTPVSRIDSSPEQKAPVGERLKFFVAETVAQVASSLRSQKDAEDTQTSKPETTKHYIAKSRKKDAEDTQTSKPETTKHYIAKSRKKDAENTPTIQPGAESQQPKQTNKTKKAKVIPSKTRNER